MSILSVLQLFCVVVIAYCLAMSIRVANFVKVSRATKASAIRFSLHPPHAVKHILILGDSTMASAGVKDPNATFGGLLAASFPDATIETLAVNGARACDIQGQLHRAQYGYYQLIMIGIGGNDIIRLTPCQRFRRQLFQNLRLASSMADRVIVTNSVNLGNIGFFLFPMSLVYDLRSRRIAKRAQQAADRLENVTFVNMYRPAKDDHYDRKTRANFIAEDNVHANAFANRYFYDIIRREANIN